MTNETLALSSHTRDILGSMRFAVVAAAAIAVLLPSSGGAAGAPRWIVLAASAEHGTLPTQLFRISTTGTGLGQITTGARAATEPSFSPDGRRVAFTRASAGIFVIRVDGTGLRRLTRNPYDQFPVWSPNGREVAFLHPLGRHARVAVISAAGHPQRTLRLGPDPVGRASWTPDGKSLVVASGGSFLRISAANGRVERRLGPSYDEGLGTPWWTLAPDGRTIALVGRRPEPPGCSALACEVFALYLGRVSSPHLLRLVDDGGYPGWTADSRRLVYTTAAGIAVTRLADRSSSTIPVGDGVVATGDTPPAWQP